MRIWYEPFPAFTGIIPPLMTERCQEAAFYITLILPQSEEENVNMWARVPESLWRANPPV